MKEKLRRIECDPICGFAVQSHDEKEVIDIASKHAKSIHSMNATRSELMSKMKTV